MIRSLEEQNIERLYPQQYDKKIELKKLNRSVVICFLELLDILIDNPSSEERNEKVKDLSILFINMHHLINEYRPHQVL
jgi:mediator of RNA polymerase II transcription subunit 7